MEYFRFELLENETQWEQNDAEYSKVFESLKNSLPNDFLEVYLAEHGFHDREINKIILSESNILIIELVKTDKSFICLEYKGVSGLNFNNLEIMCKERQIGELLEWAYDEFSESGEMLSHSVLTSCGLEFEISFKNIRAVYTDQELKAEGTILYL